MPAIRPDGVVVSDALNPIPYHSQNILLFLKDLRFIVIAHRCQHFFQRRSLKEDPKMFCSKAHLTVFPITKGCQKAGAVPLLLFGVVYFLLNFFLLVISTGNRSPTSFFSGHFKRQAKLIAEHSDKLTVGRLSAGIMDGIAKISVERIYIAPVPRNLNGMADGPLHS